MDILKLFLENGSSVTTDSRKINTGDIYFALKGNNFNGNLFAIEAIEKGASFAIVDEVVFPSNERIIKVENVLDTLQDLATLYRRHLNIPVLALTGSNGKTTTKELLAAILKNKFNLNFTQGNLNNEIGVPLTILNTKREHDFLLVEMGANHQGEINKLCEIAEPDFGLITNIGKAHLEGFGGEEGVKKGKSEMFRYLQKARGKIFVNVNDALLVSLIPNDIVVIRYESQGFEIQQNDPLLTVKYKNYNIDSKLTGAYNVFNIATAFAIGKYFEVDERQIIESIENYVPQNNRSQLITWQDIEIVLDAYNANPSSTESSIKSFLSKDPEHKIVILGDMFELGKSAEKEHEAIIELTLHLKPGKAFFIGGEFYKFNKQYNANFYKTLDEAKNAIHFVEFKGLKILIKGSRGMALERLLNRL